MEVNTGKGFAKYSKLFEDNPRKDNQSMDKQREEKLDLTWIDNNNPPNTKETQGKIGLKSLVGLVLAFLIIVTGLVAGLIVMDMKIKKLERQNEILELQNENLVKNLKAQESISQSLNVQNQNISINLEDIANALVVSESEIVDLKEEIQNLIGQNQKLINDFEAKHQKLEHFKNLHYNCSKEQELGRVLIEDLKLQNQNLTEDLRKIASAKKSLRDSISDEYKEQILFTASKNGDIDGVRLTLDLKVNVNATDDVQKSALHYAAEKGYVEVVKLLLQHGADSNTSDQYSKTPLHLAAKNGNLEIAKLLIQNKADVNSKGRFGDTPLHYASENGHLEVVKLLVENGSNINAINNKVETPLYLAARYGHPKIVEILLRNGARKNVTDIDLFTLSYLMHAKMSKWGDYQKVILLLQPNYFSL